MVSTTIIMATLNLLEATTKQFNKVSLNITQSMKFPVIREFSQVLRTLLLVVQLVC